MFVLYDPVSNNVVGEYETREEAQAALDRARDSRLEIIDMDAEMAAHAERNGGHADR